MRYATRDYFLALCMICDILYVCVQKNQKSSERSLNALIVTPTRELAIQIKDHINAIIAHTEIKVSL